MESTQPYISPSLNLPMPNEFMLNPKSVEVRNYSSFAALVFLVLEYFSNCRSEYNYIWRAPTTAVKYIYLISRYAGLLGLSVHYSFIQLFLVDAPVKPEQCKIWHIFLFGSCAISVAALDAILLLRVYALYSKNAKVHLLALPLTLQFVVGSVMMERASHADFGPHCDKRITMIEGALMGGSVILAHSALWATTFARRNIAEGRAAVVQLVVREGGWTVLFLVVLVVTVVVLAVAHDSASPFSLFVWPSAIISVITCRIILNMNMLKTESPASTELYLSTIIDRV